MDTNLDDSYIYVFVRQDQPVELQLVSASHAVFHANLNKIHFNDDGIPNVVVIGCPHATAITRVVRKLREENLEHCVWADPDDAHWGITAIATVPLGKEQRKVLANYRLYSSVAQLREHSVFNGEVAAPAMGLGENPAAGASLDESNGH